MSGTYQITTHSDTESSYSYKLDTKVDIPHEKTSCERLLSFVHYRHSYFFLLSTLLLCLHSFLQPSMLGIEISGNTVFSFHVACLLFFFVPSRILVWYSIFCSMLPFGMRKASRAPIRRNFRRLIICYVTRGQNIEV